MCHSTEIFGILVQPLLEYALGAEAVAPVHDRHLGGEIGEKQRLLDCGIAAADHQHLFAPIEEAVAGGAGGNAVAAKLLFRRQVEPARLGAGGENEAVGQIDIAGIANQPQRPAAELHGVHMVGNDPGADMLSLLLHLLHQPRALDDVGEARVILYVRGDGELSARLHALDQDRIEHGAGGIDCCRVAGRTGADDHKLGVGGIAHRLIRRLGDKPLTLPQTP